MREKISEKFLHSPIFSTTPVVTRLLIYETYKFFALYFSITSHLHLENFPFPRFDSCLLLIAKRRMLWVFWSTSSIFRKAVFFFSKPIIVPYRPYILFLSYTFLTFYLENVVFEMTVTHIKFKESLDLYLFSLLRTWQFF